MNTKSSLAVGEKQVESVKILLASGANPRARDKKSFFALFVACESGNAAIVKMLLATEAGADMDELYGGGGGTPLDACAGNGHKDCVKLLVEAGCDVDKRADDGYPPLVDSAADGHTEVVNILLAAGACVDAVGFDGTTALQAAADEGRSDVVLNLLAKGANISHIDAEGYTALHYSTLKGSHEVVKVLIGANANVHVRGKDLMSPLDIAARGGYHKCVYLLLCAKADVSAKGRLGYTPLHQAAEGEHLEVIEMLLSAGADRSLTDGVGRTPLILACVKGNAKVVALLCDAGSDIHNKGHILETNALFHANSAGVVRVLLERGCSAKALARRGRTVLHHTGTRGANAATICALYQAGADPTWLDDDGETAADRARQFGHTDTAKLLDLLAAKYRELRRLQEEKAREEEEKSSVDELSEKVNAIDIEEKQEQN